MVTRTERARARRFTITFFRGDPTKALSDAGKTDVQFNANVEDKNCTQRREDEAGRMKTSAYRRREHVTYEPADDGADDTEHDGPEDRHMHVHH